MKSSNLCPCCSEHLLRHIRYNRVYWFCPHCRQEMPNLEMAILSPSASKADSTFLVQFD